MTVLKKKHRASILGTILREIVRKEVQKSGRNMLGEEPTPKKEEQVWQPPAGFSYKVRKVGKATLEILTPKRAERGKLIYYVHGGGFVEPLTNSRRNVGVRYANMCNTTVAMLDYRTAPEAVYPAALEDAESGWDSILEAGYAPGDIILTGDSAGGNLILALVMKLRDEGRALPAALVAMAPLGDAGMRGASCSFNLYRDAVLGKPRDYLPLDVNERYPGRPLYVGNADVNDPYLSPVCGEFTDFPPMLLQTGTYDLLLSDTLLIAEKMKKAGRSVRVVLAEGMIHAYQFGPGIVRECRCAWEETETFIRRAFHLVEGGTMR